MLDGEHNFIRSGILVGPSVLSHDGTGKERGRSSVFDELSHLVDRVPVHRNHSRLFMSGPMLGPVAVC